MVGITGLFLLVFLVHPQPPQLAAGTSAPQITLQSVGGAAMNANAAAAHHALVVEFIETTCETCQRNAAVLCSLAARFPQDVFVAVDAGGESAAAVAGFAAAHEPAGCRVTLLLDPGLKVTHAYEAAVVPTVYVVDSSGKIAYGGVGSDGIAGLAAVLQRLG